MAGESLALLGLLDGAARMVPPGRPLSEIERGMLDEPIRAVVYTYGTNVDPAVGLALVLGMIALGRFQEFRAARTIGASSGTSSGTSSTPAAEPPPVAAAA